MQSCLVARNLGSKMGIHSTEAHNSTDIYTLWIPNTVWEGDCDLKPLWGTFGVRDHYEKLLENNAVLWFSCLWVPLPILSIFVVNHRHFIHSWCLSSPFFSIWSLTSPFYPCELWNHPNLTQFHHDQLLNRPQPHHPFPRTARVLSGQRTGAFDLC